MPRRTEVLNLETDPYAIHQAVELGTSFTSATPAVIGPALSAGFVRTVNPVNLNGQPVEPSKSVAEGSPTLDDLTRLFVWAFKSTGSGVWNLEIEFGRANLGDRLVVISDHVIPTEANFAPGDGPKVYENLFPADFLRRTDPQNGVDDVLLAQFTVTPGQTVTADIFIFIALLPSLRGSTAGLPGGRGFALGTRVK